MKKILITSLKGDYSGVPIYTRAIVSGLNNQYEFEILTQNPNAIFKDLECLKNVKVISVNFNNSFSPFNFIKAFSTFRKIVFSGNYDIIHLQGTLFGVIGRLISHKRVIYTHHGISFDRGMPNPKKMFFYLIEKLMTFNTGVENVALTKSNYKSLLSIGHKKVKIIENFCRIETPKEINLSTKRRNSIIAIGGNRAQKNYKYLFRLFSALPDYYTLTIAGTETDTAEFKKKAKGFLSENKYNKVDFLGSCEKIHLELLKHDIYIQTSIYEGFSLAAAEARAFGLKLALSKTSGTHEITKNYASAEILEMNLNLDTYKLISLANSKNKIDFKTRNNFNQNSFLHKIKSHYEEK